MNVCDLRKAVYDAHIEALDLGLFEVANDLYSVWERLAGSCPPETLEVLAKSLAEVA